MKDGAQSSSFGMLGLGSEKPNPGVSMAMKRMPRGERCAASRCVGLLRGAWAGQTGTASLSRRYFAAMMAGRVMALLQGRDPGQWQRVAGQVPILQQFGLVE